MGCKKAPRDTPHNPINFRIHEISIRVERVAEHGMATSWDADVLIWAASQIVEARDAGLRTSRLMAARPRESLPSPDVAPVHATITV
jgi:plasmid replication initiation protein